MPLSLPEIRAYVDRHYAKALTVDRLARLAGLSPYHFIRAFRAEAGQTPHQYIRGRRIARRRSAPIPTCFVRMYRADR